MSAWKTYKWERDTYPEFRTFELCVVEQKKILKKLSRHFKVSSPKLYHRKRGKNAGRYVVSFFETNQIRTDYTTPLSTLCHEFAHHMTWEKYSEAKHNKRFKRELKKVYTFAKKYLPKEESE